MCAPTRPVRSPPRAASPANRRPRWPQHCDVIVSVVINAAQTESVLFGEQRLRRRHAPGQRLRDVLDGRSRVVGGAGSPAGRARHPLPRRADLGRRRQGPGRADHHDDGRAARGLPEVRRTAGRDGGQGLPAGRPRRRRQQGEGDQPAAGRRAHRRRRRGDGAGPARRRGPGRAVRGHHPQRGQQLDVREPHAACAGRRLHAAVGGGHLRQGPGAGARPGARPASFRCRCPPPRTRCSCRLPAPASRRKTTAP